MSDNTKLNNYTYEKKGEKGKNILLCMMVIKFILIKI